LTEAVSGLPRPNSSRSAQGQPGSTPAGPSASGKKLADNNDPVVVPSKKGADFKAGDVPEPVLGAQSLIKIDPGAGPVVRPNVNVNPFAFYLSYYRSRDEDRVNPDKLRQTLASLNRLRKYREVHAAILGYLKNLSYHRVPPEPWMYEALGLALKMNEGPEADRKKAFNFAADLAQQSHNPNHLTSVADRLFLEGYLERVGPLLDEAMPKVPHRIDPIMMSINLAQKVKDPVRMADSVDRLLALGWPGRDEYFRIEAGAQVDQMVKQLRAENKIAEADLLQKKLEESSSRDVYVRLSWDGYADFDLSVAEPYGVTAGFDMPRTVFGGALIKNGYGNHPEEIYVCPRGFGGKYTIRVSNIWSDPKRPVTKLTLELITHEGTANEQKQTRSLKPDANNPPTEITLTEGRRKLALPFVDPSATVMETAIEALKDNRHADKAKQAAAKDGKARKGAPQPGDAKAKGPAVLPK
jgi:hypothetical protein